MSKTTLPVNSAVAKEFISLARSRGYSVILLTTESLKLASELLKRGVSPGEALELYKLFERTLAFDVVPVPFVLLEYVAEKWNICEDPWVERYVRELGVKFGKSISGDLKIEEFVKALAAAFRFLPTARFDFSKSRNKLNLVFILPGRRSVKCWLSFTEAALAQFNCGVKTSVEGATVLMEVVC